MPQYEEPFRRLGLATGAGLGASGGGALGRLSELLSPLDYPRQALANLGRSGYRAVSGEGSVDDLVSAVPGALGAALTGGLAATGAGLPIAALAGSALGGLAQGAGKLSGDPRFEAPDTSALVRELGIDPETAGGTAASLGLGVATDPLTFAGGLGGAHLGEDLGRQGGKYLEDVALTRGPGYGGGTQKWQGMIDALTRRYNEAPDYRTADMLDRMRNLLHEDPAVRDRVLSEIAPGSTPAGLGLEAMAFSRPEEAGGGITRLAGGPLAPSTITRQYGGLPPPRSPDPELMLQPARDIAIGNYRVEHLPEAQIPAGQLSTFPLGRNDDLLSEARLVEPYLVDRAITKGLNPADIAERNIGKLPSGKWLVTDAGALAPERGQPMFPERIQQKQGGPVSNAILKLLGSDRSVQEEIAQGVRNIDPRQGMEFNLRRYPSGQLNAETMTAPMVRPPEGPASPLIQAAGMRLADVGPQVESIANRMALLEIAMDRGSPGASALESQWNRQADRLDRMVGLTNADALVKEAKRALTGG